jgi:hypothetical protein
MELFDRHRVHLGGSGGWLDARLIQFRLFDSTEMVGSSCEPWRSVPIGQFLFYEQ